MNADCQIINNFNCIDKYKNFSHLQNLPKIIATKRFKLIDKTKEATETKIKEKNSEDLFPDGRIWDGNFILDSKLQDIDCKKNISH